jgi:hypothetical protein
MKNLITRIAIALEKLALGNSGSSDMGINIYPGDVGTFVTSVLKHQMIDVILQADVSTQTIELIPCPAGKRVAVLGGRVGSKEKCWFAVFDGATQLDKAYFPTTNYILPPTTVSLPHYMTTSGVALTIKITTLTADSAERVVNGFLKYVLMDV